MDSSIFRKRLARIIQLAGGVVEDGRYVTRPGVMVVSATETTAEGAALLDALGLDGDLDGAARVAAFDARITYLTFPERDKRSGAEYLDGIVRGREHTSVVARGYASVLFAGISLEDSLEFVAGRSGRSARLTSSDTAAQDDTLYCLRPGTAEQLLKQRRAIEEFLILRAKFTAQNPEDHYGNNQFNLSGRAALLHMGMCVEDWHGLLRGRLQKFGNEPGVREAFARACILLHDRFPHLIQTAEEYGYREPLP